MQVRYPGVYDVYDTFCLGGRFKFQVRELLRAIPVFLAMVLAGVNPPHPQNNRL